MKQILLMLVIIGGLFFQNGDSIKRNELLNRYDLHDKDNRPAGYIQENQLLDRYDVYGKDNRREGSWKKNQLLDQWEYEKRR